MFEKRCGNCFILMLRRVRHKSSRLGQEPNDFNPHLSLALQSHHPPSPGYRSKECPTEFEPPPGNVPATNGKGAGGMWPFDSPEGLEGPEGAVQGLMPLALEACVIEDSTS